MSERKVHFRENMGKLESQKCMSNFLNNIQVKKKGDKGDTSLSWNSGKWVGLAVLGKFCQGVALGEELLESTSMLSQTKRKFHLRSTWWANEFIKLFYKHGVRVTFKESCDNPRVVIIPPISFISSISSDLLSPSLLSNWITGPSVLTLNVNVLVFWANQNVMPPPRAKGRI